MEQTSTHRQHSSSDVASMAECDCVTNLDDLTCEFFSSKLRRGGLRRAQCLGHIYGRKKYDVGEVN